MLAAQMPMLDNSNSSNNSSGSNSNNNSSNSSGSNSNNNSSNNSGSNNSNNSGSNKDIILLNTVCLLWADCSLMVSASD